jgi:hypothetical protein
MRNALAIIVLSEVRGSLSSPHPPGVHQMRAAYFTINDVPDVIELRLTVAESATVGP